MQHSTTLHQASEWPVLLLNNTYIILIRSDHHRFMISFLGGWLQVFFLFNPFFGGGGWCYGILFLEQKWPPDVSGGFFSPHQAPWTSAAESFHGSIKDIIASQEFVNLRDSESFFHLWRWYLMILSSCGKCFLSSLSKSWGWKNQRPFPRSLIDEAASLVLPLPPPSSPQSSTTTGRLVLTAQPSNPSNRRSRRANNSGTDLPPLEPSFSTRFT